MDQAPADRRRRRSSISSAPAWPNTPTSMRRDTSAHARPGDHGDRPRQRDALLAAKANQMETALEWRRLRRAIKQARKSN